MTKEYRVISPVADTREAPDATALRGKLESQLVFGEIFFAEEEKDGWARGHCGHDGYTGWIEKKHLGAPLAATHFVTAVRSHVYRDATMKSPALPTLSIGSRVTVAETGEKFSRLEGGGWIYTKHLAPVTAPEADYVATALKFLETPYTWGGRSGFGIDCSGLMQVSLGLSGLKVDRDTEQQIACGTALDKPQRGALVFFPGHVGMMTDEKNIVHANAFHMKVTLEPLDAVVARGSPVTAIRKP